MKFQSMSRVAGGVKGPSKTALSNVSAKRASAGANLTRGGGTAPMKSKGGGTVRKVGGTVRKVSASKPKSASGTSPNTLSSGRAKVASSPNTSGGSTKRLANRKARKAFRKGAGAGLKGRSFRQAFRASKKA